MLKANIFDVTLFLNSNVYTNNVKKQKSPETMYFKMPAKKLKDKMVQ